MEQKKKIFLQVPYLMMSFACRFLNYRYDYFYFLSLQERRTVLITVPNRNLKYLVITGDILPTLPDIHVHTYCHLSSSRNPHIVYIQQILDHFLDLIDMFCKKSIYYHSSVSLYTYVSSIDFDRNSIDCLTLQCIHYLLMSFWKQFRSI